MRKHILIMSICSLFVFGMFSACGGGGGGGGSKSANLYSVSSLETPYTIQPIQRSGKGGTMVGVKVNPPTMSGLNVTLSDGTNTLQLEPLGDSAAHDKSAVCSSCHDTVRRAGAAYFAACSISASNNTYITCTSNGESKEFNPELVKLTVTHDNPAITIVGTEGLADLKFNLADDNYAPDPLSINQVEVTGDLSTATSANPATIKFYIDASDYPAGDYGKIIAKLIPGDVNMQVVANPNDANGVIASVKCYDVSGSTMTCQSPLDSKTASFPVPLTSANIQIGTDKGDYGTPGDSSNLNNLLDNAIKADGVSATMSPVAGATIPLQNRGTSTIPTITVAKVLSGTVNPTATLGRENIDAAVKVTSGNITIQCSINNVSSTNGDSQIKCQGVANTIDVTAGGTVALVIDGFAPINIKTADPVTAMPIMMHVDSGSIPMQSLLTKTSVTLRFVIDTSYAAGPVQCIMTDENNSLNIVDGLVGKLDDVVMGLLGDNNNIIFPKISVSSNSTALTTVCTYSPGVLNLLGTNIECSGGDTKSTDLLALLNSNTMKMVCTDGERASGETLPFKLATGLLGIID